MIKLFRYIFSVVIISVSLEASCQDDSSMNRYSFDLQNVSLTEALETVENRVGMKFYYVSSWTDSIRISTVLNEVLLNSVMTNLLSSTKLNYTIWDGKVILTYDVPIFTEINFYSGKDSQKSDLDFVFQRELFEDESQLTKTIEIGKRANFYDKSVRTTISGQILNVYGHPIEGVQVYITDPFIGSVSDVGGNFELSIPKGKHKLMLRSIGYKSSFRNILVNSSGRISLTIEEDVSMLNEVTVSAEAHEKLSLTAPGLERIKIEEYKSVPIILGERDIVKVALSSPGIQNNGEGSAGIYVRGGKADQNLMLLNGIPIYNSAHFLGFFSSFNPDAVSNLDIHKGTIPAQFGGRLSSVFDLSTKKPSFNTFKGSGGIGLVTSRLSVEIPLVEDKTSIFLSGRSTYSQWLLNSLPNSVYRNNEISFSDFIFSLSHKLTDKDYLSATAYLSNDKFNLTLDSLIQYENIGFSLNWEHDFSDQLKGQILLSSSSYTFGVSNDRFTQSAFDFDFGIRETGLKILFDDVRIAKNNLIYGFEGKHYNLSPGRIAGRSTDSNILSQSLDNEKGAELALFISNTVDITPKLSASMGFRYSYFSLRGPNSFNAYSPNEPLEDYSVTGTRNYKAGQEVSNSHGPEFRISSRYYLDPNTALKLGYGRTRQYIHLLTNTTSLTPIDIWKLTDPYLQPEIADQISLGTVRNFRKAGLETSLELYTKRVLNSIDYKVGANLLLNENIETELLQGKMKAYGVELSIKRTMGKLNGFINYTYSRSFQKTLGPTTQETINEGKYYRSNYDKPHDLNVFLNYRLSRRYSFSTNGVFFTGRPVTLPVGKYQYNGGEFVQFTDRNEYRIPNYFRLDIGLNIEGNHKIRKLAHSFWTISVYNLTGRNNIYSLFFKQNEGELKAYSMTIFPRAVPSVSYNFKF